MKQIFASVGLGSESCVENALFYANNGADGILLFDHYTCDAEHDRNIGLVKEIVRSVDIDVYLLGGIRRLEDVKKYLYAGAKKAVLDFDRESNRKLIKEASERFGKEKIAVSVSDAEVAVEFREIIDTYASEILLSTDAIERIETVATAAPIPVFAISNMGSAGDYAVVLQKNNISGIAGAFIDDRNNSIQALKLSLKAQGVEMDAITSAYKWSDFKLNSDGMIPVIVQDHKTNQVLMLAYMNEEAYNHTIETGKVTYYSRSRNELWIKGDTSGHYQYLKSMYVDCDLDTILVKVHQIGAACHTGSYSCFFNTAVEPKASAGMNPMEVFEKVYAVIEDRKIHPKEGSYTNYLFDKGIDKILKKVGEEATEIVIAAKNPDPEEIKYEVSDFLYHVMVLMVERGVTWEDITRELATR